MTLIAEKKRLFDPRDGSFDEYDVFPRFGGEIEDLMLASTVFEGVWKLVLQHDREKNYDQAER